MTQPLRLTERKQQVRGDSPWSKRTRVRLFLWRTAIPFLFACTPKPLNAWRVAVLRLFGAKIGAGAFIHPRARIEQPWNIELGPGASVGDRAQLYSLGPIRIGARTVVAQETYLCTGTHDFERETFDLLVAPIEIGSDSFIGLRAVILPGVHIGDRVVIGAAAVVNRDIDSGQTAVGSPARVVKRTVGNR